MSFDRELFAWIFLGGALKQDVTSVTLVNNTQKVVDITCPANKRRLILNIKAVNCDDVARNIQIWKFKEAACTNLISLLLSVAAVAAADFVNYPNTTTGSSYVNSAGNVPQLLEAGNTIRIIWAAGGASTGATDADGLVVEYLEVDVSIG